MNSYQVILELKSTFKRIILNYSTGKETDQNQQTIKTQLSP